MLPVTISPWRVYAGDDSHRTITIQTSDNTPLNLSEWSGWLAQWRRTPSSSTAIDLPLDLSELAAGRVTVRIPAALSAVDGGRLRDGVWDMQAEKAGITRTWVRGRIDWSEDVTR